ncbi:hypothetical protein pdam_00003989, partial [Pocillopora damicornis]
YVVLNPSTRALYLEEDKIHIASTNHFIIADHECSQSLLESFQCPDVFIHFWCFKVCIFWLVTFSSLNRYFLTCWFWGISHEIHKIRFCLQQAASLSVKVFFHNLFDGLFEPIFILLIREAVGNDSVTLVLPKVKKNCGSGRYLRCHSKHALFKKNQLKKINHLLQLCRESPLGVKVATTNGTEDLVDRSICGQSTVQDGELTFKAAWNVIAASSWLNHSCHELNVNYAGEITGFVKTVKTFHLHYLSNDFIGNLK